MDPRGESRYHGWPGSWQSPYKVLSIDSQHPPRGRMGAGERLLLADTRAVPGVLALVPPHAPVTAQQMRGRIRTCTQ